MIEKETLVIDSIFIFKEELCNGIHGYIELPF